MKFRLRQPATRIPRPRVRVLRWFARRSRPPSALVAFEDGGTGEVDAELLVLEHASHPRAQRRRWMAKA